jgi:predicted enzyme related to lactoylglutathione lyase
MGRVLPGRNNVALGPCRFLSLPKALESMQNVATQRAIDVKEAIVVIAVNDLSNAREWYSRLFGKQPDLEPFPGNVEFKIGGAWVQISKGNVQDSSWSLQLEVRNLARERERITEAEIVAGEIKTVPDVISYFDLRDPDGNTMRWFQVLTSYTKVTGIPD